MFRTIFNLFYALQKRDSRERNPSFFYVNIFLVFLSSFDFLLQHNAACHIADDVDACGTHVTQCVDADVKRP